MIRNRFEKIIQILRLANDRDGLSPERRHALKAELMVRLQAPRPATDKVPRRFLWPERSFAPVYSAIALLIVLLITDGTVQATNKSLPGELLYPVKRIKEKVELQLVVSAPARAEVQARQAVERLNEFTRLTAQVENAPNAEIKAEVGQHKEKAAAEIEAEVETALNALNDTQEEFKANGNTVAATHIQGTLQNLSDEASREYLDIEREHGRIKVKLRKKERVESSERTKTRSNNESGSRGPESGRDRFEVANPEDLKAVIPDNGDASNSDHRADAISPNPIIPEPEVRRDRQSTKRGEDAEEGRSGDDDRKD